MTSTAKGKQRQRNPPARGGASGKRRTPSAPPPPEPTPSGPLPFVAAAATLLAAAQLWPSPASRPTWATALFLAAVVAVAYLVGKTVATVYGSGDIAPRARGTVLLVLVVLVPLFVDLRTFDTYNLPKFTMVLIGALAIAAVWPVEMVLGRERLLWRNGLHWPVLALVAWTAVTTATSVSPRMSILGNLGTNDGLLAAGAFAVIFFSVAQDLSLNHVKAVLSVLYFGAGGLTALYGLIQLHDRVFGGPPWDWLRHLGGSDIRDVGGGGVFSTLGNPNDLGGFLAVLAPVGLILLLLHRSRRARALIVAIMFTSLVELLQSASRGALLAALVALGLAGALLWRDRPRWPTTRVRMVAMAGLAVLALVALVVLPSSSAKFSSLLDLDETLSLRVDLWKTGVAMGNDRPLVGHGPDTWADHAEMYRTAEMAERWEADAFGESAHNRFVDQLAGTGYPGLVLLVALLGLAALRAVGTWKRLRQVEAFAPEDQASRARVARLLLIGVASALVAHVVQSCFTVPRIGPNFVFWVLLGLMCGLSVAAGVPTVLRPRTLVGRPATPAGPLADIEPGGRRPKGHRTDTETNPAAAPVAVLACAGLLAGISLASRPYRADHSAWAANHDMATATRMPPDRARPLYRSAAASRSRAVDLNPWEPSYLLDVGDAFIGQALSLPDGSAAQLTELRRASDLYERAIAIQPHNGTYLERHAEVLFKIHEVRPGDARARDHAIGAFRRAARADPAATNPRERLEQLLAE